jgi:hypothetical protein
MSKISHGSVGVGGIRASRNSKLEVGSRNTSQMSNGRKTSASGKTRSAGYRVNSETDQEKYVREVEFE